MAPLNAVAVWNVAPDQNNYITQTGRVSLAVSSATAWPSRNGVLAEFTFQVQPGVASRARWLIRLSAVEITENGFDNRSLPDSALEFITQVAGPFRLDATGTRFTANGFSLMLTGEVGARYEIQASEDLKTWIPLVTLTNLIGTIEFVDTAATNFNQRFYRARNP
jgi:hypothetical protein